jgi:predicted AlkP superfamily phosphohydrolase/phosphomutase
MMITTRKKLAMIGIDSANFAFIKSNLASLPNFAGALGRGVFRPLESTGDLIAGSVWPTFYTGKLPGEHGVYHILQWDADSMQLRRLSEDWFYCEPFWKQLERGGLRATVVDVPISFPPHLEDGIEVTNWGVHNPFCPYATNRPGLDRDIRARFGKHPMAYEIPVKKPASELPGIRDSLIAGTKLKADLSRWILGVRPWDFALIVLAEAHHGGHTLWPLDGPLGEGVPPNALLDVYRAVYRALGIILDGLDRSETSVMLFAPHGMGPNRSKDYLTQAAVDAVNRKFAQTNGQRTNESPRTRRSPMRFLRETVPITLQNLVARSVPLGVRDYVINRSLTAGHDWSHTPAIAVRGDVNGYVRFNLRGRERDGALEEADRRAYERLLTESMLSLRSVESGNPIVSGVHLTEGKFSGSRSGLLPDAIIAWNDEPQTAEVDSQLLGRIRGWDDTGPRGHHRSEGFMIMLDSDGEHGTEAAPMHITELAPMILNRLLGSQPGANATRSNVDAN